METTPKWMTPEGLQTLQGGYLLPGETVRDAMMRCAKAIGKDNPDHVAKYFEIIWNGWLGLATPVFSNLGTDRGYPISCLTGDSWINTKNSGVQIKDIKIGEEVLTHEGRYRKVTNIQKRMSNDDLYLLKVMTRPTPIKITGNHPVLTNLGWVRVDELDERVHLIATNYQVEFDEKDYTIDTSEHLTYNFIEKEGLLYKKAENLTRPDKMKSDVVSYWAAVKKEVPVTEDLAWALGLWCAEGSLATNSGKPNGIRVTVGAHERDFAEKFLSIMTSCFNLNGNISECTVIRKGKENKWLNVNINGLCIGALFKNIFGDNCKTKTIPDWIIDLPKNKLKSFWLGVMQGDGKKIKKSSTNFSSIALANPKLLLSLYNIALKLDIFPSLQMQCKAGKLSKDTWVYVLGILTSDKITTRKHCTYAGVPFGKLKYCPIKKLEKIHTNEWVWDLTVEEDHSFSVAGVVVHNCFGVDVDDTLWSIGNKVTELMMMAKHGGGVGVNFSRLRGRGAEVKGTGGTSSGVVPWAKIFDSATISTSQGGTRRGNSALYLDVEHPDIEEFLNIRRVTGDPNTRCLNISTAVNISDAFMHKVFTDRNPKSVELWKHILKLRMETGFPYLHFIDNANNQRPQEFKDNNLPIHFSNLCLAGDTLVLTSEGPRKIKDLVGKSVTIYDGKNWVENSNFTKTSNSSNLFRIHLSDGSFVDATPHHKWQVIDPDVTVSGGKYHTITTKELIEGHKILHHLEEGHGDVKLMGAYAKGFLIANGSISYRVLPTTPSLTLDELKPWLLIGDAKKMCFDRFESSLKEGPWLRLCNTKKMCFDRLKSSLEEIPINIEGEHRGLITEISLEEGDDEYVVRGLSSRRELLDYCTTFKNKLPDEWINWSKESKLDFLAGLFDGEGRFMKINGRYQITAFSKDLLSGLQLLMKTLGLKVTLSKFKDKRIKGFKDGCGERPTSELWRLTLSSFFAHKLSGMIKFERLTHHNLKKPNRYCADFSRVMFIEELGEAETFCTKVPSTSQFALANGLMSGNCSEIFLPTDPYHSFSCILSSMNLAKWHEWKDTDAVYWATRFLDGVCDDFLIKARFSPGFENVIRFTEKARALGLGVLGWHSFLQQEQIPFDSFRAMNLNSLIFKHIRERAEEASIALGVEKGIPEWGIAKRNTTLMALAPTVSNALICGGVSSSTEPWAANIITQDSAKGTFIRRNKELEKLLTKQEDWDQITKDKGSVLNVESLTQEQKEVFLTAREINQFAIIRQAASRQKWIDQGQSINLFFDTKSAGLKYISDVHKMAWEMGMKSLYYCRSGSVLRADLANRTADECKACEG
jgi:ribonucleoside-diphosphate reductase alpha chain